MRLLGAPDFRSMVSGKIGLCLLVTWLHSWTFRSCSADTQATCRPIDFHYEFTECDSEGGRWRVSVPKPNTCIGGAPNPPERTNCSMSCKEGYFLNRTNMICERCLAGTYSLGGGIQVDSWDTLPAGFESYIENVASSFRDAQRNTFDDKSNCSQYAWKPSGRFISSEGGPCSSILTYSVKLVKAGTLTFEYQHVDDMVLFTFAAQDERCQSAGSEKYRWPTKTEEGEWKTVKVALSSGLNVLYWKTLTIGGDEYYDRARPVRIRTIRVMGVSYTSECTPCPAGTSSTDGASNCDPCPENSYSERGSPRCKGCNETQYAPAGSETCLEKQACTELDYYATYTQCNEQNTSLVSYTWRKPQICRTDLNNSQQLPTEIKTNSCMECNPGMEQSKYSSCTFCAPKTFSNGIGKCKACPASTAPHYGLYYHVWHQIPPYITTKCISLLEKTGCSTNAPWIQQDQYIRSGQGHSNTSYLILNLDVSGFRIKERIINGQAADIGQVRFTFDLECVSNCELVFMEASSRNDLKVVKAWDGSQIKQTYSHSIHRNDTYTFTWAFQKIHLNQDSLLPISVSAENDVAKIYEISVTNTINGGASECTPCPKGAESDSCIPCPTGHYFEHNRCILCPPNTYVVERMPYGRAACKPCGAGLKSDDRQTCYSDCTLSAGPKGTIDLTNLPKFMTVEGSKLFTSSGMRFHHLFNISLCGKVHLQATCVNNVTSRISKVTSSVCRATIVPSQGENGGQTISTQAVSIGDWLIGVTHQPSYEGIRIHKSFIKEGTNDIHYYYIATSRTPACPNGRNTTVTLRCDIFSKDPGEIIMPEGCPDGTCDGCNFHFLWETRRACRICNKEDYEVVKGECKGASRTLHYIEPTGCIPSDKDGYKIPKPKTQSCSVVSFELQSVIAGSVGLGVLLVALLFYCWKKNRKLEYKYMKLVQSGSSKEGELPTAESCAIYDDDDDQYDAVVASGTGRSSLLSKFQSGGRGSHDDNSERIHLTKNRSQL